MVFKCAVPLLQYNLFPSLPHSVSMHTRKAGGSSRGGCLFCRSSDLRSDKLLEVADRVVGVALHADLLAEAVVAMKAQVSQASGQAKVEMGWARYQITSIMMI